ncbi:hypothetical protein M404DRAFT_991631 [Pisolithus tinctorius Marx 270]|uniref:Uncharacterized protein n=1 Tax=Pisolithus tinctorius Marx 270 TaxID=870435 RepID=A0A0C3PKW5_PISTI|nr:hypothetical protein M404DRAFT_991631 [Pisolithus tinctorius Marx 270]
MVRCHLHTNEAFDTRPRLSLEREYSNYVIEHAFPVTANFKGENAGIQIRVDGGDSSKMNDSKCFATTLSIEPINSASC